MKKSFIVIFIISCLFCCSCSEKEITNTANSAPSYFYIGANCYPDGMIFSSDPLMYLDYSSMEKTVLCAKPNCTHNTSECVGKIAGDCPVIYNGYIYFFTSKQNIEEKENGKREFCISSKLCRVSMDNSDVEDIVIFTDCVPRDYDGMLLCNDKLYFIGDDYNPTENEYGDIITSNQGGTHFLCSVDLNTKEYKNYGSVYDGDKQYEAASNSSSARLKGCRGSTIYIGYSFRKENMPTDKNAIDTGFTVLNFEFDMNTNELIESELPRPIFVDEDTYMYFDADKDKTIVKYCGQEYIIDENIGNNATMYNCKVFSPSTGKWYGLNDSSIHSMGKYAEYVVVGIYNNDYILKRDNNIVKLNENELISLDND